MANHEFQRRVNDTIVAVVRESPGITLRVLESTVAVRVERTRRVGDYFMGGGYFAQRVDRLVKRGRIRKLFYRADGPGEHVCNHYFHPDAIPTFFDLKIEHDRCGAADYVRDAGHDDVADAIQKSKRWA